MTQLPSHIGRYQIIGLLGTGGMAEVFLGRSWEPDDSAFAGSSIGSRRDRPVVVKRILPHLARQQHFVDMFRDEARIAAQIRHPNVVEVYELGETGHELYMVMEYLAGESAAGVARQLALRKKLLSFGLCAHLLAEVCAGLHAAHDLYDDDGEPMHIVHRDVSPANILITYGGEVKILDFGIAVAANRLSKTDAGQVKGKYAYMSPEQCRGKPLDRRSDVFSLGTVLYELSTCRRLFKRPSDMETLEAVCNETAVPPSQLVSKYPPELERICLKALQKNPEDRYQTAAAMRRDLLRVARELNQDKQPKQSIAKVMRKLFAERIEQKNRMLEQVRTGNNHVPTGHLSTEDESMELPAVEPPRLIVTDNGPSAAPRALALAEPISFIGTTQDLAPQSPTSSSFNNTSSDEEPSGPMPYERRRRAWSLSSIALLIIPLLLGLGLGGWWATQADSAVNTEGAVGPVGAVGTAGPVDALGADVDVELDTIPTGARVYRDNVLLGQTPLTLRFERSSEPVELTIKKEGFVDLVDEVVPKTTQKLRLGLEPLPEAIKSRPRRSR